MKPYFLAFLLVASPAIAQDNHTQFITKEIEFKEVLNLSDFGGPHIEILVRSREMTFVSVQITDYTQMVPIARTNIRSVEVNSFNKTATVYGTTSSDFQPTKHTRRVNKERGVSGPNGRKKMYLLFHEPRTGIEVYFLDSIAHMNHNNLVVAVPKRTPPSAFHQSFSPAISLPAASALTAPAPARSTDGLLISAELFAWYVRLNRERESLDTSNPKAIALFNRHVADYREALNKSRRAHPK